MNAVHKKSSKVKQKIYRKRKATLFKKAHELRKFCDAEVAVIIYKHNQYFIYRSTDQQSWPLSIEQIVDDARSME